MLGVTPIDCDASKTNSMLNQPNSIAPPTPATAATSQSTSNGTQTPTPAFTSPFQALVSRGATPPTPFGVLASQSAGSRSGASTPGGFTSPFSTLNTPSSSHTSSSGFPTAAQAAAAFPPPTFLPKPPAASSLSFPAPSFGSPPHAASAPVSNAASHASSFPTSHLNSAPTTAHHSVAASRFPSAPVSAAVSVAPSRIGSGPNSAAPSKSGSPTLSAMRGEPPPFAPLAGPTAMNAQPKASTGLFSPTPSPHPTSVSVAPFGFPGVTTNPGNTSSLNLHPPGHHSLNGTPVATPLNLSLPGSSAASPMTSPRLFPTQGIMFPRSSAGAHLRPLTIHSENSSARSTPGIPDRMLGGRSSGSESSASGSVDDLPAEIPTFPPELKATQCSSLAALLTEGVQAPAVKDPFFPCVTVSPPTPQASRPTSSMLREPPKEVLEKVNFSLAALVLDAAATATAAGTLPSAPIIHSSVFADSASSSSSSNAGFVLKPFDFSQPSPDDLTKARLQAVPNRGNTTDAASSEQLRERAMRKKHASGAGGRLNRGEEEEDEDEAFLHQPDKRAAMGGMLQLSTGSVGAVPNPTTVLIQSSKSAFTSRPFEALHKSIVTLKRHLVEELVRGAQAFALVAQAVVREPRKRDVAGEAQVQSAASSSSTPAAATASSSSSSDDFSLLSSPWQPKGISTASAVHSIFTPALMPYQIASIHRVMQQEKARGVEECVTVAQDVLPKEVKELYQKKRAIFISEKLALPVPTAPLSDQALELVTPTPQPSFLSSLAAMNMLVLGAPGTGVSTLLGNLLYQLGRLPFSLVKPKHLSPGYWEQWQGQQFVMGSPTAVQAGNPNMKLNQWNQAKYNFKGYTHCLYTNRYKVNVYHPNMGGLLQSNSTSAHSSASSKQAQQPTPQQTNLSILSALHADFVLLIVDASAGSSFQPTVLMQQQLLLAYMSGVRQIILCLTRMDAANWSEKKMTATIAGVISSFLKPLGYSAANISTIPVSGLTGENLVSRKNKDLCSWYDGPTLHELLDKMVAPMHKQVEPMADRKLVLQIMGQPQKQMSILNESTLDTVKVRVQVVSGTVLHSEPVALLDSKRGLPIGPVGIRSMEREEKRDARDLAVYEEEEDEEQATGGAGTVGGDKSSSSADPKKKLTRDADGRKLTNNERKAAEAAAKREHARLAKKEKAMTKQAGATWNQYAEEANEEDAGDEEADSVQGSNLSSSTTPSVVTSLIPAPLLTPGEVGVLALSTLTPPASNSDDNITAMLTGRDPAEFIATHSAEALAHIAKEAKPGDMLVLPGTDAIRGVTRFKAELLALTTWPADLQLKAGQAVTFVPMRGSLPSPTSIVHTTGPSLWAMLCSQPKGLPPLGSQVVVLDRLVNILNKATRAALRKKPEFLVGPVTTSATAGTSPSAGDLASVECSSSKPIVLEPFNQGGPRLANFFVVFGQEVIAVATVTHATE